MTHRLTPQAFEPLDEEEQLLMETIEEDGWEQLPIWKKKKYALLKWLG